MVALDYIGFLHQLGGYAFVTRQMVNALVDEYDVRVTSLDMKNGKTIPYQYVYNEYTSKEESSERIQIFNCTPNFFRNVRRNPQAIALGVYETLSPPQDWLDAYARFNSLAVISQFNYDLFVKDNRLAPKLFYLPVPLDFPELIGKPDDKVFKFLWIGTWRERKNYIGLIQAFTEEFKDTNDVQLVLLTRDKQQAVKYIRGKSNVVVSEEKVMDEDMYSFIRKHHCVVLPTFGEGLGLVGIQSLASKVPLITSNVTGCKDYANRMNCTLIDPEGMVQRREMDGIRQFNGRQWANITVKGIRTALKGVYTDYQKAMGKTERGYQEVRQMYCKDAFLRSFQSCLSAMDVV